MTSAEMAYSSTAALDQRDQLVMEELSQVYYIAARIRERLPQHIPMEDLVNAGVVGLLEACRNYDSTKPAQFKTFAKFRIQGAILDSLRDLDWAPRLLRRKGREIDEVISRLEKRLGRTPSEPEIADELHIKLPALQETLGKLNSLNIMGQQVTAKYDSSETVDVIESAPSRGGDNPFDLLADAEQQTQLAAAIAKLSEREQLLISLYYREELTMKEVAAVLRVGEVRVSQIHNLAMAKLRALLKHLKGHIA